MRFYNEQHKFYCGVDMHTRRLHLCILDQAGKVLLHRSVKATPEAFWAAVKPYRKGLVVAAECMFTWYWLADFCEQKGIPFVLGHALYMKAIHGGKSKNDKIDSEKIARMLRGGMLPQAYVYPAEMRSTRDLLRRRMYLVHKRAEILGHIQNMNSQYNLPEIAKKLIHKANREGVADRFNDTSVRKSIEIDLAMLEHYDPLITDLELCLVNNAKVHDPQMFHRLRSIPGIGKVLALVLMYEIHDINRFGSVGRFISYSRLVKCKHESDGKVSGTGGRKIGNAHLRWAFSEATCLFIRQSEQAKQFVSMKEKKYGKGKALSILAARLGRAVYWMLKHEEAFDENRFFGSGAKPRRVRVSATPN